MKKIQAAFFERNSVTVARIMIGRYLVHEEPDGYRCVGRIVETEAYRGDDPACHAWGNVHPKGGPLRPAGRSAALFGSPGTAYVYLNYGMYWLLNVVTEPVGMAGAVLIRAVEPVEGIERMEARRPAARRKEDLTNGPGKLTLALGVGRQHHSNPLTESPLYLATNNASQPREIGVSPRIGIRRGVDLMWRFFEKDNPFVSPGRSG